MALLNIMADKTQETATATGTTGTTAPAPVVGAAGSAAVIGLDPTEPSLEEALAADLGLDQAEGAGSEEGASSGAEGEEPAATEEAGTEAAEEEGTEGTEGTEGGVPEGTEETEETETEEAEETEEEGDEAAPPKGLEKAPKWAQKRIQKQSETIRGLRAQLAEGAITVAPTPASPLADIDSLEKLESAVQTQKNIREWCRKHSQGGTVTVDGKEIEISAEQVAEKLERAEAIIEAAPDWKQRLAFRQQQKPWETGERVAPGLLTKGTPENAFMTAILKACPEIKVKIPDFEGLLGHAARSYRMEMEQTPTKEFPHGRAKWVRMELDKNGNVVTPKKAAVKGKAGAPAPKAGAAAPAKPKPPTTPGAAKPALKPSGAQPKPNFEDLEARAAAGDLAARRELLKHEMSQGEEAA